MITDLKDLMHGIEWDCQDVSGYYASEKLDGCRAFWTGKELLTRSGRVIHAPERVTRRLPAGVPIEGELYAGVNGFQLTSIAARYHRFDPRFGSSRSTRRTNPATRCSIWGTSGSSTSITLTFSRSRTWPP